MESAAAVLQRLPGEIFISKRKFRQADAAECVRLKRDSASQCLGFTSRPFVTCGLPIKRPSLQWRPSQADLVVELVAIDSLPLYGIGSVDGQEKVFAAESRPSRCRRISSSSYIGRLSPE
jgi:hypothetical protein